MHHIEKFQDTYVIKSGTDFREFNKITLKLLPESTIEAIKDGKSSEHNIKSEDILHNKFTLKIETTEITSDLKPDPKIEEMVRGYMKDFEESMCKVM